MDNHDFDLKLYQSLILTQLGEPRYELDTASTVEAGSGIERAIQTSHHCPASSLETISGENLSEKIKIAEMISLTPPQDTSSPASTMIVQTKAEDLLTKKTQLMWTAFKAHAGCDRALETLRFASRGIALANNTTKQRPDAVLRACMNAHKCAQKVFEAQDNYQNAMTMVRNLAGELVNAKPNKGHGADVGNLNAKKKFDEVVKAARDAEEEVKKRHKQLWKARRACVQDWIENATARMENTKNEQDKLDTLIDELFLDPA